MSDGARDEVLALDGALSFESLPDVLKASQAFTARENLPDRLTIDFQGVDAVDSSAVLVLEPGRSAVLSVGSRAFLRVRTA